VSPNANGDHKVKRNEVSPTIAGKTKAEVVQVVRDMTADEGGEELFFDTLDWLDEAEKKLKALAGLASGGVVRLLIGASVVAIEREQE
jgi:hypothetical protein